MKEIQGITEKYGDDYVRNGLKSLESLKAYSLTFYKDVAAIYDCLTRIKNIERNPTGFNLNDAPVLGLLVRIWKLLNEVIKYYEQDNAETISFLERPIIEAAVIATYLMENGENAIEDYRKCSYKNRLRVLRNMEEGSAFYKTKAGKRLINSVQEKMAFENFRPEDFAEQKKNRWKIQGKNFFDIFAEIEHENLYAATYGMMSESIHGSWNESMDWCLLKNDDGTFSANPFSYPADIRFVSPLLRFTHKPYRMWLQRIDANDNDLHHLLDWSEHMNTKIFMRFDDCFDG
jgi:hypothetical protein